MREYFLGLDVGSVSVNAVVVDGEGNLVQDHPYTRHNGKSFEKTRDIIQQTLKEISLQGIGITGSQGESLSKQWKLPYYGEIVCHAKGTHWLHPQARTIIDIGGSSAKYILLDEKGKVKGFGMNSSCASGTGSFLDQQAKRLQLNIENDFSREALKSENPARVAGRCAVFAKSDMIHLQQKATPLQDICLGLCEALCRSYKSIIARGSEFIEPISFQGGVAANEAMLYAFKKVLGKEKIFVSEHFFSLGALGAVLFLLEEKNPTPFDPKILEKEVKVEKTLSVLPRLSLDYEGEKPSPEEEEYVFSPEKGPVEAWLGIDIGSVSTNVVLIDRKKRLIAKSYLPTSGRPIQAVQKGLKEVRERVKGKVRIKGVGTTGSGRYLIGAFVGADVIKNEITCQARGALNLDPQVDTIFEIGGQDSKYISLRDGVVVDFTMNKACAAGTGSFLEEQAEELDINIKGEFQEIAFSAKNPVDLGDRCTVFMESALFENLQKGVSVPNLVAGLAYSVAFNYLNKVVENRKIGERIFFQGGTACNRAVVAAFEKILGKKVIVPPHNEVLGAIGAAIVSMEETKGETKFKGWGLADAGHRMESFECKDCPNSCKVNQVWVEGEEKPLTYGDRCEKYSGKERERIRKDLPNLFWDRERLLFQKRKKGGKKKIGIPRALHTFELSPLWESFFTELGYEIVLSDRTNDKIIHRGVEAVRAETCFPVKVGHGHVLNLLEKGVDYIFLPSLIDLETKTQKLKKSYSCPWSQSFPYFINSAVDKKKYSTVFLEPKISLRRGVEKALFEIGRELKEPFWRVKRAVKVARRTQLTFYQKLREKGKEVLKSLGKRKGFILISRPYNGCDPGVNLEIAEKMRELGMLAIPMDFLDLDPSSIALDYPNMYWGYGQKILAAAKKIKETLNLYPIYITNFGCGPDSFITKYFEEEMDRPFLEIQIDEHSAEAGIITRLEAFLDSISHWNGKGRERKKIRRARKEPREALEGRILYIPYMDDHSYALKAAFEALGQRAEVMEVSDYESLREGQKYTSGRECYPCILTTGDMLKVIKKNKERVDEIAFFMGTAQGPCRFGQYKTFQEQLLRRLGYEIPIISLDSENSYGGFGVKFTRLAWEGICAIDVLRKVQRIIRAEEINPGETDKVYLKYRNRVGELIRRRESVLPLMDEAASAFRRIKRKVQDKPVVTVVGEIYVRHNPFSNQFIIDELERLGVKVELASMREWFMYTNAMHKEACLKEKKWFELIKNRTRHFFQLWLEKRIEEPFHELIQGFEEPPIEEIIKLGEKYLHRTLRGEAILSVGKTVHSIHKGRDGVVNVMPFTCMPGTLVDALMTKVREEYPDFPLLSLAYDGSAQVNYLNKVRTFVSQVEAYHREKSFLKKV